MITRISDWTDGVVANGSGYVEGGPARGRVGASVVWARQERTITALVYAKAALMSGGELPSVAPGSPLSDLAVTLRPLASLTVDLKTWRVEPGSDLLLALGGSVGGKVAVAITGEAEAGGEIVFSPKRPDRVQVFLHAGAGGEAHLPFDLGKLPILGRIGLRPGVKWRVMLSRWADFRVEPGGWDRVLRRAGLDADDLRGRD